MYRIVLLLLVSFLSVTSLQSQGPIAYYPFNGNASDESGNGHHGSVNGATLTADRFGNARSAYLFDGNDFIAVSHSPELVFARSEDFTINAWVRICGPQSEFAGILVKGPTDTYYPGYQLVIRDINKASSVISNNDGNWTGVQGETGIDDGYWHFVSLVVTPLASRVRIYVDGRLDDIATNSIIEPDFQDEAHPLFIGKERNSTVFLKGGIDDIRIYNRALSETEIGELYRENGWTGGSGRSSITKINVCANSSVVLTARDLLPPYQWSNGATSHSITVSSAGRYWVKGDVAANCPRTDTFDVAPVGAVIADAGPDIRVCGDDIVRIGSEATGGMGPYRYAWTPAEGLSSPTEAMPVAHPTVPTRYTVVVTDARGCSDTASVLVTPVVRLVALVTTLQQGELVLDPEIGPDSNAVICDSVTLRNLSDELLELDAISLARNYHFSIPSDQLPLVIPARSDRRLAFCYRPLTSFDQFDTLTVALDCGITMPITLRANALIFDECDTRIGFRMLEKRSHFKSTAPFPNPAISGVTLRVERAAASLQPIPQEQCRLYSSDGIEVASAVYAPESAWSRDGVSYERGAFSFATDHLPAGIYYVRIQSEGETISHPLVVTR